MGQIKRISTDLIRVYPLNPSYPCSLRLSRSSMLRFRTALTLAFALVLLFLFTTGTHAPAAASADEQVYVRVNQVGYRPSDAKIAVAFARAPLPDRFTVVDAATRQAVFEGASKQVSGGWGQFEHHAELDFSQLKRPGRFFLSIGAARSQEFAVGETVYAGLPDQLLEFMREQRCGYNPYLDAVCHPFDGRTAYGPAPAGTYLDATGGWHDAGDQLKYLLTASNATAQMLLAYLLERGPSRAAVGRARSSFRRERSVFKDEPSVFKDEFNELGQTGADGMADVLDEARWGLEWMLKLHPAPRQLYHQVADDRDHHGWRLPQNETADYGWGPGGSRVVYFADGEPQGLKQFKSESDGVANLAGRYAAAMALGYQIWRDDPRQRAYAEKLLRAGE